MLPEQRHTGRAFEQVLGLDAGDLADGGEDMRTVHGGALDAVAVVDAATARLLVDVELRGEAQTDITITK